MEALLTWVAERVAKFPRDQKFTVGNRLIESCLDAMVHLVEASYRRDKNAALAAASRALVRARVLMRLAHALRCVSEAQHLHFAHASRSSHVESRITYRHESTSPRDHREKLCDKANLGGL